MSGESFHDYYKHLEGYNDDTMKYSACLKWHIGGRCNLKCPLSASCGPLTPRKFDDKCHVLNTWKRGQHRETPCCQALPCTATSKIMPPSTPFPSVNSPSILNPSYSSYTKLSAKTTSLLNPSVTSPAHHAPRLPHSAPNLTWFQSLFGKRLLNFQYELSSLKLLVLLSVLQLLSSCSDSSGHPVPLVQGQLFVPPLLLHTSFHLVSFCLHVLLPPDILASWHSLPTDTPCWQVPLLLTHNSNPIFLFLFSCQAAWMIGSSLSSQVSRNYPANPYQNRTSASKSHPIRLCKIQTSCSTVALTWTMHYYRMNILHYPSNPN